MKTLYIFTILLFLLYIAGSCNDDQQKLFSGSTTMHFALSDNELDSIACSFLNTSESYITVNLPVELNGYAGQNYRFRLKADSSQTTAIVNKHYQPLEEFYEIKKDEYSLNVPITLNYSAELDSLSVKLVLQLEPAAYMSTGISYRQEATIVSSNLLPPIPYWDEYYSSYFGPYSRVKHRYILSELKLNTFMNFETKWANLSSNQSTIYGWQMNNFFAENEIYDEYGQRIEPWMN